MSAPANCARPGSIGGTISPMERERLARMIDHTLLAPTATDRDVAALCAEATELGVAAVCVSPARLPLAVGTLGPGIAVCTVVGSAGLSVALGPVRLRIWMRSLA